ncbi:MAG: hypothetical protein ACP6IS_06720 [Candidatus Asgardarchaeia archaeon]
MKIMLVNVGANKEHGFLGPIFRDGTFVFLPKPEPLEENDIFNPITYKDLGLAKYLPKDFSPYFFAHLNPEFQTYTYGHKSKNHEIDPILKIKEDDIILFYTHLEYRDKEKPELEEINEKWGAYIIGFFVVEEAITYEDFIKEPEEYYSKFLLNAHLRYRTPRFDILIKGDPNKSAMLYKAIPLSDSKIPTQPNDFLKEISVNLENDWIRSTIVCSPEKKNKILARIIQYNPYLLPKIGENI